MIHHPKYTSRHALEEAFTREIDNLLMGRLQTQAESDEAKERLAKATGWNDRKLISQLASLGVTAEGLMAVLMVPLVLIAWANHGVDHKEREFVMSKAERFVVLMKNQMVAAARCSGGFLGLRRICANEHRLITAMSRILDDCMNEAAMNSRAG